jgi:hypothetical protein
VGAGVLVVTQAGEREDDHIMTTDDRSINQLVETLLTLV